jgi:hypothetical protein
MRSNLAENKSRRLTHTHTHTHTHKKTLVSREAGKRLQLGKADEFTADFKPYEYRTDVPFWHIN